MARHGVRLRPADNTRVAGWSQIRSRLKGDDDGRPMIATFSTCRDSIRTLPVMPHDESKPEDIDTDAEDHAVDEWRYACMSRPWTKAAKPNDAKSRGDYVSRWKKPDDQAGSLLGI
jgi:hypothetical protein